jgi:4-oxalomesaconate tautomerase
MTNLIGVQQTAIPCTIMRGGTSKGPFFLASSLPSETASRDQVLLAVMGSPDIRQIDGLGGADSLTSKVAVVSHSTRPDADVDYLFLQVVVDEARVDGSQNCGNMLAGVGPFAIENGLVRASHERTKVHIHMVNTGRIAIADIHTPGGEVQYIGDTHIDGVPGTASPILLDFPDMAGASCGALLPTNSPRELIQGVEATLIDNGMPVVIMRASDLGKTGAELPAELQADTALKARVEAIRLEAGRLMNLGDVTRKTVPKMCLVCEPRKGGAICTRTFIPHVVHKAIGVFGAVSVATACVIPGSVAFEAARVSGNAGTRRIDVEHPTGFFTVEMDVETLDGNIRIERAALLRTTRKLMSGYAFVPRSVWSRNGHPAAAQR